MDAIFRFVADAWWLFLALAVVSYGAAAALALGKDRKPWALIFAASTAGHTAGLLFLLSLVLNVLAWAGGA